MKLCAMLSLYPPAKDGHEMITSMRKLHANGFRYVDFSGNMIRRPENELNGDDWEKKLEDIIRVRDELGMTFLQSHLPQSNKIYLQKGIDDPKCEKNPVFIRDFERALHCAGRLGVKHAVVHAMQTLKYRFDREANLEYNWNFYHKYVDLANSYGMKLCFENLNDQPQGRRFSVAPDEMLALVKMFGEDKVGLCWDFGHGHRCYGHDQLEALEPLMPYLHATHIDDNMGKEDLHLMPTLGQVKWEEVVAFLRKHDYHDAFCLEVKFIKCVPEDCQEAAGDLLFKVGQSLLK